MQRKYFRIRELASVPGREGKYPFSPATVWRWVANGTFPAPVRLSNGVTAWPAEAIDAWEKSRATAEPATGINVRNAAAASVAARRAKRGEVAA